MSKNDGSLWADNNSDKSFERVHLNVSSNSVENVEGSKLSKNAYSSAVENIIDVDVSHTSDSCSLSHQSKFLNISSKLTNNVTDAKTGLHEMKLNYPDKLILGHVSINSIRKKFHAFTYKIGNNLDIILISETKFDDKLLTAQFFIKGFSAPYRQDRNRTGGGLLLFVREDVPSRYLNPKSKTDIETLSVEITLRKRKWFLYCSYNPHKNQISNHLECLNQLIDAYNAYYQNFIFIGDFNISVEESQMENFWNLNCLESLMQKPTCYKNPSQPTCIDLILTNWPNYFQHSEVFATNLSDFHLLTVTELKMNFQKQKPKILAYCDYKTFDNNAFRHDIEKCSFNIADLNTFKETVFCIFNKHAPMKRKYVRANETPFMTK